MITGHDHHYERFAPLDAEGGVDKAGGIRSFIAGTGGAWLFPLGPEQPISEIRDNQTYGVMRFMLYPGRYEWTFEPAEGATFTDAGSGVCH